jgi:hypothetical protein
MSWVSCMGGYWQRDAKLEEVYDVMRLCLVFRVTVILIPAWEGQLQVSFGRCN